jgi:hypothetical protein
MAGFQISDFTRLKPPGRAVGGGLFFRCLAPKFSANVVGRWVGMKDISVIPWIKNG